jgi:hypothetical protein
MEKVKNANGKVVIFGNGQGWVYKNGKLERVK